MLLIFFFPFQLLFFIVCYSLCCCNDVNVHTVGLMKDYLFYIINTHLCMILQMWLSHTLAIDTYMIEDILNLSNNLYITTRGDMARRISNFI